MAKAKVLADTISITSDVLTNENIRKAQVLAPSVLRLLDIDEEIKSTLLYEVTTDEVATFTKFGATFKDGKSLGRIEVSDENKREEEIKLIMSSILTKVNAIEGQVQDFLDNTDDLSDEIEFLD